MFQKILIVVLLFSTFQVISGNRAKHIAHFVVHAIEKIHHSTHGEHEAHNEHAVPKNPLFEGNNLPNNNQKPKSNFQPMALYKMAANRHSHFKMPHREISDIQKRFMDKFFLRKNHHHNHHNHNHNHNHNHHHNNKLNKRSRFSNN